MEWTRLISRGHGHVTVVEVMRAYSKVQVRNGAAMRAIGPLQRSVAILQGGAAGQLTAVHALLFQACLAARCLHPAAALLHTPITDVRSQDHVTVQDFLLYCYYGALVCIALKRLPHAQRLLLLAITAPALALSAIVLESYKKFLLISLIADGKVCCVIAALSTTQLLSLALSLSLSLSLSVPCARSKIGKLC
jgi:COP9 signalosome complex subunit 3